MATANKVKYGVEKVYYAVATFSDDGEVTYGTPVHIPGARAITLDHEGDTEPWYADNIAYVLLNQNSGYSGSLEVAILPDSFRQDILGEKLDSNGVMYEDVNAEPKPFALLFEVSGDQHKTRHVFYNCSASRPSVSSETIEDTKEPQTDEIDLVASPLVSGIAKARTTTDVNEEIYNSWFTKVYTPTEAVVTKA